MTSTTAPVVVIGANGFVGAHITRALSDRGVSVRAVVRHPDSAPKLPGVSEIVGDFSDAGFGASVVSDAASVLTTVHPMSSDRATQHRVGVLATAQLARAAAAAGVARLIHISTAAVYDRSPEVGDVDEASALVDDDAGDYAVTKRDADLALAQVDGITRIVLRPPAILGPGPTSTWNTLRPAEMREEESARQSVGTQTFAWVHVSDLAALAADLATGRVTDGAQAADGPVAGACVAVNVTASRANQSDYFTAVTQALGVEPVWLDAPAWTGRLVADRAHGWGWSPKIELDEALQEIVAGLTAEG